MAGIAGLCTINPVALRILRRACPHGADGFAGPDAVGARRSQLISLVL
jgi:hypothetical protein